MLGKSFVLYLIVMFCIVFMNMFIINGILEKLSFIIRKSFVCVCFWKVYIAGLCVDLQYVQMCEGSFL